jgi:glutaredoxin
MITRKTLLTATLTFVYLLTLNACSANPSRQQTASRSGALWTKPESTLRIKNASVLQMFYSPRCPHCRRAKAWLESQGVSFNLRDISLEQHRSEFRALSGKGVPTFFLKGRRLEGFDPKTLEAFLDL